MSHAKNVKIISVIIFFYNSEIVAPQFFPGQEYISHGESLGAYLFLKIKNNDITGTLTC